MIRLILFSFNSFRISQLELKQQIESLNEELVKVREALDNHPDLDPYVKKLIACKHKVTVVLNVLQASQVWFLMRLLYYKFLIILKHLFILVGRNFDGIFSSDFRFEIEIEKEFAKKIE